MCTKNGKPRCGTEVAIVRILRLGAGAKAASASGAASPKADLSFMVSPSLEMFSGGFGRSSSVFCKRLPLTIRSVAIPVKRQRSGRE